MNKQFLENFEIHQFLKLSDIDNIKKNIFPLSFIQAIYDANSGKRLDSLLAQNNCIVIPFITNKSTTLLQIPIEQRRKHLIVSFSDYENNKSLLIRNSDETNDDDWSDLTKWEGFDFQFIYDAIIDKINEIFEDIGTIPGLEEFIEQTIINQVNYIFNNLEDFPDIMNAIKNAVNNYIQIAVDNIFNNINDYPEFKLYFETLVTNKLIYILSNISNYPDAETALQNSFKQYIIDTTKEIVDSINETFEIFEIVTAKGLAKHESDIAQLR